MTFHVGQKVVCVDDDWYVADLPELQCVPKKHSIYTIRAIEQIGDGDGFLLCEIVNPVIEWDGVTAEPTFDAESFRPIVERKTDISIFKKMLIEAPKEVEAAE